MDFVVIYLRRIHEGRGNQQRVMQSYRPRHSYSPNIGKHRKMTCHGQR